MDINCKILKKGLLIRANKDNFYLRYPEKIWSSYPKEIKEVLVDNLIYLLTMDVALLARIKNLKYNTAFPFFKKEFDNALIKNIPGGVEDYKKEKTKKLLDFFKGVNYKFEDDKIKEPFYKEELNDGFVMPFSCGKDSLLTLAVCDEIGSDLKAVYINDTVSPTENKVKLSYVKKVSKEFDIKVENVVNEVEKLNDFEYWNKDESCLGYLHMMNGFCFILLPFLHFYKLNSVVLGNQQNMNFSFKNKDGFLAYPSYNQSSVGMREQDKMIKLMTANRAKVFSVIEPLTNIAITKILHNRYGNFAKYEFSCDSLDTSDEKRWCKECSKCARLSIFMRANNINPKVIGINKNLLDKNSRNLYVLFDGKEVDSYEKSREARDEQLLAFYLAFKNNARGYLIEKFKKEFLEEAKEREDELYSRFFRIYPNNIPKKIEKDVLSIYKEELF